MASWKSMGHAMRRRAGVPSSHTKAAGGSMKNRSLMTPEEVLASVDHANSPRRYVGMQPPAFVAPSASPEVGTLMPKKNTQAADPTIANKANRTQMSVPNAGASERMGARYRVSAKFPAVHSAEASATMGNARIVPSVVGKSRPNFEDGVHGNY